jgi:hypothetical protein
LNDEFISKVILNDRIVFKEVEGLINANWYIDIISWHVYRIS